MGSFDFSGDVYKQLEQFEQVIDVQLEEFQQAPSLSMRKAQSMSSLQSRTPIKGASSASSRNSSQLLRRFFPSLSDDAPIPAMTTSDSMFSMSSEHSMSMRSRGSVNSRTPIKKTMRMNSRGSNINTWSPMKMTSKISSQRNAEWAIIG